MSITTAVACGVALALFAGSLWIRRRGRRQNPFTARSGVIVDPPKMAENGDALVYVNKDGSVRELTEAERTYVETEFSPFDGARPYIKSRYADRNGWGRIEGYLPRAEVPEGISIHPARPQTAVEPQTGQTVADSLAELIHKHQRANCLAKKPRSVAPRFLCVRCVQTLRTCN